MTRLQSYKNLLRRQEQINKAVEHARSVLAKNCKHPEEFVTDWDWEHDNGYGRQTKHIGKHCGICLKVNRYGNFVENKPYEW